MDSTALWILNSVWGLLLLSGGFVIKQILSNLDRTRDKIEELEYMIADLRVENERNKGETINKFVTKDDFSKFESEVFKRFDKFEEKLDHALNKERGRQNR